MNERMRRSSLIGLAAITIAIGVAAQGALAFAKDLIRCTAPGASPVTLDLATRKMQGKTLACLRGGGFVADMTPCAPNGGFGLSYPTGSADLSGIVMRWQDYADHLGGVASFYAASDEIVFTGGFMSPANGMQEQWRFSVDRLTGAGTLTTAEPKATVSYTWAKARQKL